MIIQKMNNVLVKHGKVTFAIFTAVVIVSFVWFFTPGVDGSLLLGGNIGPNSKYGDVLGHAVTYADVGNALKKAAASYEDSRKKLIDSNQSVVKKIGKLERLGLAPKRSAAKIKTGGRISGKESIIPAAFTDATNEE